MPGSNNYNREDSDFFDQLSKKFVQFNFRFGKKFTFRPPKTIVVGPREEHWRLLLLHELGHALLKHADFKTDVERLKMEAQAWQKAQELAGEYGVEFDEDFVQEELDTYRDWLHQKSRCPKCGLTRFETPDGRYHCPRCENFKPF